MNLLIKTLFCFSLAIASCTQVFAQSDSRNTEDNSETVYSNEGKGWAFGLNIGMYYASKNTANFYNGNPANVNNINFVMSNYYWHQEIFQALDANDSISAEGPQNMHYKLAMRPGLYAQYCFSPTLALVIEFNYMRLKIEDVITFDVDPPIDYAGPHDYRLYPMRGSEERVYADIGLKRTYPRTEKFSWFATGGLNVNSTKVKQCSFYVEEKEYSMVNTYGENTYVPNSNMQTYSVYQGGIGVGMYAGGGVSLKFANGILLEPGITAHWLLVKLDRYQNMNPGIGAYLRFMY